MEESNGDLPIQKGIILSKFCGDHLTVTNLVEVLRSFVVLTDPREGKLTQSRAKTLNSVGILKNVFAAVPGPTLKTSVE